MRWLPGLLLMTLLAACGAGMVESPYAPIEDIRTKAYRAPGPATITVFTVVSNRSGGGGHTAMMINGSQRVIFDPAGSFQNEVVPERHDVLFGISPAVLAGYKSAHARSAYHVVSQTFEVTPEQAEIAFRLAQQAGPVPKAACTSATARLLRDVPGFGFVDQTVFPAVLMRQLAERPGVQTEKYFEDDEGTILDGVAKVKLN